MSSLTELAGSQWSGDAELWLDPTGDEAIRSECTMAVEPGVVRYTWSYEGEPHQGTITLTDTGADFHDTWHSKESMPCESLPGSWALVDVWGTYGDGPKWGWRITVAHRPGAQLVLLMTNVTPWGEHGRAVRMVCARTDG